MLYLNSIAFIIHFLDMPRCLYGFFFTFILMHIATFYSVTLCDVSYVYTFFFLSLFHSLVLLTTTTFYYFYLYINKYTECNDILLLFLIHLYVLEYGTHKTLLAIIPHTKYLFLP